MSSTMGSRPTASFRLRVVAAVVASMAGIPTALEAGEAYLKGGWLLYVGETAEIEIDDRWWVAGGHDWNFTDAGLIGFELSGAYRSDVIGGKVQSRLVPLDVLVNVRWKSPAGGARPYAAAGIGLASAFVWTEVAVPGFSPSSDWQRALGYQFLAGVQLRRRFLLEAVFERTYATAESVQANPVGPDLALSIAAGVTW